MPSRKVDSREEEDDKREDDDDEDDDEDDEEDEIETVYVRKAALRVEDEGTTASAGSGLRSEASRETAPQVRVFSCLLLLELLNDVFNCYA